LLSLYHNNLHTAYAVLDLGLPFTILLWVFIEFNIR